MVIIGYYSFNQAVAEFEALRQSIITASIFARSPIYQHWLEEIPNKASIVLAYLYTIAQVHCPMFLYSHFCLWRLVMHAHIASCGNYDHNNFTFIYTPVINLQLWTFKVVNTASCLKWKFVFFMLLKTPGSSHLLLGRNLKVII